MKNRQNELKKIKLVASIHSKYCVPQNMIKYLNPYVSFVIKNGIGFLYQHILFLVKDPGLTNANTKDKHGKC